MKITPELLASELERFTTIQGERQRLLDAANEEAKRAAFQLGEIVGARNYVQSLIEHLKKPDAPMDLARRAHLAEALDGDQDNGSEQPE